MINCNTCIHHDICGNRYANDGCEGSCSYYLKDRPVSEWIFDKQLWQYKCSNCGALPTQYTGCCLDAEKLKEYHYCRFCGAAMVVK